MIFAITGMALLFAVYFFLKSRVETLQSILRPNLIGLVISRLPIIPQYIGKIFFPVNLSLVPLIEDASNVYGYVAMILIAVLFFVTKSYKKPLAVFGLFWLLVFLFLLLLVLPPVSDKHISFENPAYEHRLYLPMMGFLFFLGSVVNYEDFKNQKLKLNLTSLMLVIFSVQSFKRIHYFDNALPFFEKATADAPHSATSKVAYATRIYHDSSQKQKAVDLYNEAYTINPYERYVNMLLGLECVEKNDLEKAEYHYRREINNTDFYDANFALADLLFKKGQYDSAIYHLRKLVRENTKDERVYNNLLIL